MSESHTGKTVSEETRKKISENHADVSGENHPMYGRTGENHPMYGKHHSEEARKKMSEAKSGENNPNVKYSLWDITCVHYYKKDMYNNNREPNPCKCFGLKYNGKYVPIGHFHDFVSVEIINNLIEEAEK